jgi:hypothetical protein
MSNYDPIPDLVQLGYTCREAAFLYLVGQSSGFFLGRQYSRFLQRKPGALIQQFVQKAAAYGHIDVLDYGQRRHIYHLKSRTVYRLLGDEESQNRRAKGDQEVKTKLMILDYVLQRSGEVFLCSPLKKVGLLVESQQIASSLPAQVASETPSERLDLSRVIIDRFPMFIETTGGDFATGLQFTYFDHGTCTIKGFQRHLRTHKPVFDHLARFQMVYVAVSERNLPAAEHAFHRLFPGTESTSDLLPFGRDHLIRFFEAVRRWEQNDARFTQADLLILKEGELVYSQPEHELLQRVWLRNSQEFDAKLARITGARLTTGRLSFCILRETYPVFGYRYSGKPVKSASESQIGELSGSRSIAS